MRAQRSLGEELLTKVDFSLVSEYLDTSPQEKETPSKEPDSHERSQPKESESEIDDQVLIPKSEVEKSGPKSALELEPETRSRRRRGRKASTPLIKQVEQAYAHLNDLDWLDKCRLSRLPEVRDKTNSNQVMSRTQGLRTLLMQAARQMISDRRRCPTRHR